MGMMSREDVRLAIDRMLKSGAPAEGLTAWAAEEVLNEVRRLRVEQGLTTELLAALRRYEDAEPGQDFESVGVGVARDAILAAREGQPRPSSEKEEVNRLIEGLHDLSVRVDKADAVNKAAQAKWEALRDFMRAGGSNRATWHKMNELDGIDPMCPTGECKGTCRPEAHGG